MQIIIRIQKVLFGISLSFRDRLPLSDDKQKIILDKTWSWYARKIVKTATGMDTMAKDAVEIFFAYRRAVDQDVDDPDIKIIGLEPVGILCGMTDRNNLTPGTVQLLEAYQVGMRDFGTKAYRDYVVGEVEKKKLVLYDTPKPIVFPGE